MKKFFLTSFTVLLALFMVMSCSTQKDVMIVYGDVELSSPSACLVDYASGEVLFEKNAHEKKPVASMVKMMTILLTLEDIDSGRLSLEDKVLTSENASGMGGSQVFLDPYVKYTVEDLLKSVIMASANDASVALSEHISGSEDAFVRRMNKRASELGMNDTVYKNCTGLPAPMQYSTAFDSTILLGNILKHDLYHKYSTVWIDKIVHKGGRETELVNTNKLIRYYDGCDGGKTGSTSEAGCCLCASAKRNDMRLISCIVGAENSKTRFNECSRLFTYGFANFANQKLIDVNDILSSIKVVKGKMESVNVYASENFTALVKKGDDQKWTYELDIPELVKAPMQQGNKVGKIHIMKNGEEVKTIDVVIKEDVQKVSYMDMLKKVVEEW